MQTVLRGVNESVEIGPDVVVTVLEIRPAWVRLGIQDLQATPSYWEETVYLDGHDEDDEGDADLECELVSPLLQNAPWSAGR